MFNMCHDQSDCVSAMSTIASNDGHQCCYKCISVINLLSVEKNSKFVVYDPRYRMFQMSVTRFIFCFMQFAYVDLADVVVFFVLLGLISCKSYLQ